MRKIDFRPGYHEWHIVVNDEIIYTVDDILNRFDEVDITEDEIYDLTWNIIDAWKEEVKENEKIIPLTEAELNHLREVMYNTICDYYL